MIVGAAEPLAGREPFHSAAATLLAESGCTIKAWRSGNNGVAWTRSPEWYIEVPQPRGPISYEIFAHEIAHQMLHRPGGGRFSLARWRQEIEAEEWALATFERFGLPGVDRARAHAVGHLERTALKVLRRAGDQIVERLDELAADYPAWARGPLLELRP